MAENEDGMEKTEQATPKRLSDARGDGNVAKSQDVNSVAILVIGVLLLSMLGSNLYDTMADLMRGLVSNSALVQLNQENVRTYFYEGVLLLLKLLFPFFITVMIFGVISNVTQTGFLFTTKPLGPHFEKLFDLPGGLSRVFFNKQALVEFAKNILKMSLVGLVGYLTVKEQFAGYLPLIDHSVQEIFDSAVDSTMTLLIRITEVLALIAVADFFYTRWKYNEDMKMTKQETKDEAKNADLPPEIKQKIMQRMAEVFMRSMKKNIPKADVVITNPIHVAVAIAYDADNMTSPKVVGKGLRLIAEQIKEIARENSIPIVENPPLARAIYKEVEVGDEIPEEFFKAVAEVLAFVYRLKQLG